MSIIKQKGDDLIYHSFKAYLEKKYKNLKTVNGYVKDVELFTTFIEKEGIGMAKIRETHIKKFNLYLNEEGYSNHTIARKNSSLRLYLKFLRKQGVMTENPMEDIKQPMLPKRDECFTETDMEMIEKNIQNSRDQLLFSFAYYDKVKLSEMVKLKKVQYEKNQGVLYLKKKAIIVHSKTKELLDQILTHSNENEYLLMNQHGKPLTESGAYYIFKTYFDMIGKSNLRPIDVYKKTKTT